jgi:hypothetical protein
MVDGADEPYRRAAMRCIVVSDGNLKADTRCAYCQRQIGDSYARKIGTHFIYCNYDCHENAEEVAVLTRNLAVNTWTVNS